jgi:hypothetical protein
MIKILRNIYLSILLCTIAISLCVGVAFAQESKDCKENEKKESPKVVKSPQIKDKNKVEKKSAQPDPLRNKIFVPSPNLIVEMPSPTFPPKVKAKYKGDSAEKSIEVNEKVNISFCVSKGKIKINGWNRNEIRAFVDGSDQIGIKVVEKSQQNKKPVWVMVLGYDPASSIGYRRNECISGKVIELDVPFGAMVNVKGGVGGTMIDSVANVKLKNVGGDVMLNNIKNGINAINFEGNITVKGSGGSMALETTTGNIVAVGASSSDFGDTFKAKTSSGAVVLQEVEYKQAEVYSNSGSVKFIGNILCNGQYEFTTIDGSITLKTPKDSNADLTATYGGSFSSKIPIENIKKSGDSKVRTLTGTLGEGCAKLILKTYNGAILIELP